MKLEINNLTKSKVDKKFLEKVAIKTLNFLNFEEKTEISLVIIGEARMRNLNKKYRGKNRVTDVLAFDYGELFICLPQAKKQAKRLGHSFEQELATLLIHGILHLAGYTDEISKEYKKMMDIQRKIVGRIINQ